MMMKAKTKPTQKLSLNRETISSLAPAQLRLAQGASDWACVPPPTNTCSEIFCPSGASVCNCNETFRTSMYINPDPNRVIGAAGSIRVVGH